MAGRSEGQRTGPNLHRPPAKRCAPVSDGRRNRVRRPVGRRLRRVAMDVASQLVGETTISAACGGCRRKRHSPVGAHRRGPVAVPTSARESSAMLRLARLPSRLSWAGEGRIARHRARIEGGREIRVQPGSADRSGGPPPRSPQNRVLRRVTVQLESSRSASYDQFTQVLSSIA